jgi:hypothetical protein
VTASLCSGPSLLLPPVLCLLTSLLTSDAYTLEHHQADALSTPSSNTQQLPGLGAIVTSHLSSGGVRGAPVRHPRSIACSILQDSGGQGEQDLCEPEHTTSAYCLRQDINKTMASMTEGTSTVGLLVHGQPSAASGLCRQPCSRSSLQHRLRHHC